MDKNEETGASTPGRRQLLGVAGAAADVASGLAPHAFAAFIASTVEGGATR